MELAVTGAGSEEMLKGKRTVLVVEDNELNRELLVAILEDDYRVLEACNGEDGLEVLRQNSKQISLVLLDIQMPVLDGYGFLKAVKEEGKYGDIPVVMTTASDTDQDEIYSLKMGATDFVTKPYNPEVVKMRVASIIRLKETSAMLYKAERDSVTGAYSREFFMEYAAQALVADPDTEFDMVCMEVEAYRLLRDRYDERRCDALMREMTERIAAYVPEKGLIGRIGPEHVAIFMPHVPLERHEEVMRVALNGFVNTEESAIPNVKVNTGVYGTVDRTLPIEVICSNALMPLEKIRYQYGRYMAVYDDSIREKTLREQFITEQMEKALENREFHVYYQPKYDIMAKKTSGGEALVRWIHPERGFMSPGDFIPLFEHNGFIVDLDRYMLDAVCRDLRAWIDAGKNVLPISINVSQSDFDQTNLVDRYEGIVDSYGIPHELIHFEITESANAVDTRKKNRAVTEFSRRGFGIELDDFGAGYSTLSSLGEMPIDVMKIDMSLIRNMFEGNHAAVLQGVLYTAAALKLTVVAEGVETKEQSDALRYMCMGRVPISIQGYYYAKPMPADKFEEYLD